MFLEHIRMIFEESYDTDDCVMMWKIQVCHHRNILHLKAY